MTIRPSRLSTMADALVFAFPILILCVPRGAGVFLAGVGVLLLAGWRGLGRDWRRHAKVLVPLSVAVLAFMTVCITSKFLHQTPWNVIDNPSRALLAILTCWLIVHVAPDPGKLWRGITIALVGALLIVSYQKLALHLDRPSAWTQAIAFANMVAALALIGFARPGETRRVHAEAWFNIVCASAILMMNGTRGAVVATLVTVIPMLLVRYRRRFTPRMFAGAVVAVAILATAAYQIPGSTVSHRLDQAVLQVEQFQQGKVDTDVGARLKIWEIGLHYFVQHPWSGAGVGQFARILRASTFCQETQSLVCVLEHGHNDAVEASATMGIPGLLTMFGLFLVPGVLFWRALRICRAQGNDRGVSLGAAGLAVVMASLISGLTQVTTAHQANVVFYAGVIGMLLGLAGREAFAVEHRQAATPVQNRAAGAARISDQPA
ncbi:cell shape-determining protein [Cupriavidus pauculus]|uniref:Cell shape-determining protein n=2 Tax=Cupriavidus pauculus TaxID=82633 RepID=A0A2N5CH76_9BURK|nr:cell shape-determining protein [Cupriavidus pauculus]